MVDQPQPGLSRRHLLGVAGAGAGLALVPAFPASADSAARGTAGTHPTPAEAWPVGEPYQPLHGGTFSGPAVAASRDPLVRYRWTDPVAADPLQVYQLRPVAAWTQTPASFDGLHSAATGRCGITVKGAGSIRFDFGLESPAWLEFDSADLSGTVEMSISEYNEPGVVNPGPAHPVKTLAPVRYGDSFRLELNADLFEGVRFGWIHVRTFDRPWHITAVRAVCQAKPTNYNGTFHSSDEQLNRLWYAGAYGVRVGFQGTYMAPILMDRGDRYGWAGDCNPIQSAALVAFGDWDYVKANLDRTVDSSFGIETYSLYWVLSLLEYYQHTGDTATLTGYLDNATGKLDHGDDIYADPNITFYGWDERLGGGFDRPNQPETKAAYRMLFIRACLEFADAAESVGRADLAATYRATAARRRAELHADPNWFRSLGVHALGEAVNAGCVDDGERAEVYDLEFADRLNRLSFSTFNQFYILQAMAALDRHDEALVTLRDNWGGQLDYGGTTFFEVFRPDWLQVLGRNDPVPNSQSGWTSLSHPWGGGVTSWLSQEILGISPTSPGFGTVDVFPLPGRGVRSVSGSVPTPHGTVSAEFDLDSGTGQVVVPAGSRARIGIPSGGRRIERIQVNGRQLWRDGTFHRTAGVGSARQAGDRVVLDDVPPGRYRLKATYRGAAGSPPRPAGWNYPMRFVRHDTATGGNWGTAYGRDGHVLFNYDAAGQHLASLPGYVSSVTPWSGGNSSCLNTVWESGTGDARALARDASGGFPRNAGVLYSMTPSPGGMTMVVDVAADPGAVYQLAMYFVDWDSTARRVCVEVFDLDTLKRAVPVQLVDDFHDGHYLVYRCDRPVRIRVAHVLGANAVLSGLFFDPAGSGRSSGPGSGPRSH
ncbi:alpha-L-rhamnosidase C-terminal domain-containing protein [Streptomyces sp. CA-111067]|uniref:alpha-L-rhamnosidase-related protein n=1 Tax=Streptomyces sp. CA-111067 TaxID=3240046 RepID=UPI003D99557C